MIAGSSLESDALGFEVSDVDGLLRHAADNLIMPKYGALSDGEVKQKSSATDLVTEVDLAVESFLCEALKKIDPTAAFIGEESAAADPTIVSALEREGRFWILDPLDGTRNFVRGVDEFATILAFVENGVTKAGWISACPEKTVFSAFRGKGVQVDGADFSPQKQDAAPTLERQHPLTGMKSLSWLSAEWRDRIKSNLDAHHKAVAGHCSAYAYLHLLRGDVDFKISSRIHPWDHLAGALMLDEMGGQVGFIDKPDEFDPYRPMDSVDRPLLAVAPGVSWRETAQSLAGPSPERVTD